MKKTIASEMRKPRGVNRWLPAPRQVPDRILFNVPEYTGKHGKDGVALWKASPCGVQVDDVASAEWSGAGLGMRLMVIFAAFSISHPDREPLRGFHFHRQSLGNQSAWVG